jgi:hypothetical protein
MENNFVSYEGISACWIEKCTFISGIVAMAHPRRGAGTGGTQDRCRGKSLVMAPTTQPGRKFVITVGGQPETVRPITPSAASGRRSRLPAPQADQPALRPGPASVERV